MAMTKQEAMGKLRERGATRAVVEFSGGNDQGGADRICLYNGEEEICEIQEHYPHYHFDQEKKEWIKVPLPEDEYAEAELCEALTRPVYQTYGTFAGDFDVDGKVVWDVESDEVWMKGEESTTVYEPFERECL
jgi:hypothetical protein